MGLCVHRRVATLCAECSPRSTFLKSLGHIVPHRWAREVAAGRIRRSELRLIEAWSSGGRAPTLPKGREASDYWAAHDRLYPGGSARSQEWGWLRDVILARDGRRCCVCGGVGVLQVDHIQPLSRGGQNAFANLWTLCKSCHEAKTGRRL